MYVGFLTGFVVCGFIGFFQAIKVCLLEFNDPVFGKPDRYMLFICYGIILIWVEAALILAYRI